MKKVLSLVFILTYSSLAYTQDVIVRTNGEKIHCIIINIDSSRVYYNLNKGLADNSIGISDVLEIKHGKKLPDSSKNEPLNQSDELLSGTDRTDKGQAFATDKGANIVSLMGSLTKLSGGLTNNQGKTPAITINLLTSFDHFVAKNFFIGGGFAITSDSQSEYYANSIEIGPDIGYAFGNSGNSGFPYISAGFRYYRLGSSSYSTYSYNHPGANGTDILFGIGYVIPVKSHIGITIEGNYHLIHISNKDNTYSKTSGSIFSINLGIVGLIF